MSRGPDLLTGESEILDLRGEVCPYTFLRAKLALEERPLGAALTMIVDHRPAADQVPRSLAAEGQEIASVEEHGGSWRIVVVKRAEHRLHKKG